jgi:hypothetical protein
MPVPLSNVCYRGNSGHGADIAERPLMTKPGLGARALSAGECVATELPGAASEAAP